MKVISKQRRFFYAILRAMHPTSFSKFIPGFSQKLSGVKPAKLGISDYSARYLSHLLQHKAFFLKIYARVLEHAVQKSTASPAQLCLADYGCGNGLLGLFAKYCGFKIVLLCDTNADFTQAARALSAAIAVPADAYVHGDIHQLADANIYPVPGIIVGTDVIEHIYNLEDFFSTIASINQKMITVFTTASNPENPILRKKLERLQIKDELHGSAPEDGLLTGAYEQEAFFTQRIKIIQQVAPQLDDAGTDELAKLTRGMYEPDIRRAIQIFLQEAVLPEPAPGVNTCDPATGSWTERILPMQFYMDLYERHGFSLEISNGFYDSYTPGWKQPINFLRNRLVLILGKKIAPFLTLTGS